MEDKKYIKKSDIEGISFFFSIVVLSFIVSFFLNIIVPNIPKFQKLEGYTTGYTQDSVYVHVDWEIKYNYFLTTNNEKENLKDSIEIVMDNFVEKTINKITYKEYNLLKERKIKHNNNGIKIILFNN